MWMTLADLVQSAAAKHKRLWYVSNKLLLVGSDITRKTQHGFAAPSFELASLAFINSKGLVVELRD
jgi:hypothetical protein